MTTQTNVDRDSIQSIVTRPILFSGPMVMAILDGRKTQTRRIIKPRPPEWINKLHGGELSKRAPYDLEDDEGRGCGSGFQDDRGGYYRVPYGLPGDRLWVREAWCHAADDNGRFKYTADGDLDNTCCHYRADGYEVCHIDGEETKAGLPRSPWCPSIHMPRWASRITLEITGVRVERLNEISQPDIAKEGIDCHPTSNMRSQAEYQGKFRSLWESINGAESWIANPWVWVVEFKRV